MHTIAQRGPTSPTAQNTGAIARVKAMRAKVGVLARTDAPWMYSST